MPRFSKPVVEDENGELIIPGAYEAAPGGFVERRPTFEWDNHNRASATTPPAPLVNVDDLSVDLSDDDDDHDDDVDDDDDDDNPSSEGTSTSVSFRNDSSRRTSDTVDDNQDQSAEATDEEQGRAQQQQQQSTSIHLRPRREEGIPLPIPPMDASVEMAPPQQHSTRPLSSVSDAFACGKVKTLRAAWIRVIIIGILVLIGMGVIVATQGRSKTVNQTVAASDSESFAPPSPLLAYRKNLGLQSIMAQVLDGNVDIKLQPNWNSPYFEAMYWILYQDPLQLTLQQGTNSSSRTTIQQRFLMAAFYFATSVSPHSKRRRKLLRRPKRNSPWKQCGAPLTNSNESFLTNLTDRNTMNHTESNNSRNRTTSLPAEMIEHQRCTHQELVQESPSRKFKPHPESWRWLSATHECDWAGVKCNEQQRVTSIVLNDYGLSGTLIDELSYLESLRRLSLPYNGNLGGEVPVKLLGHLASIELQHNQHEGVLAGNGNDAMPFISGSPLQTLRVHNNKLSGSLSTELNLLTDLRELSLGNNDLTGSLSPSMHWSHLQVLSLKQNRLSGSIPADVVSSSALQTLDLSYNAAVSGSIPSELGLASNALMYLALGNCHMQATLPIELFRLTQLQVVDLENNNLQGTMATEIGQLSLLRTLNWQNNDFQGSLPTQLGQLKKIEDFRINGNGFYGEMPTEFCDLGVQGLPLAHTVDVVADCTRDMDSERSQSSLLCPTGCCSSCCQKTTGECTMNPLSILGLPSRGNTP